MYTVEHCDNKAIWNEAVRSLNGHPLQLWGWGEVKAKHGWSAVRLIVRKGSEVAILAQVLVKPLPGPFRCLAYVPRGPVGRSEAAMDALVIHVKSTIRPVCLVSEPDTVNESPWRGWRRSTNRILLARTATMDLTETEDDLLAKMSKKTRQYIRKSAGEGVTVRRAASQSDIDACLSIYKQTASRAGFALHDDSYYHDVFEQMGDDSPVFMAEKGGEVLAFLWPIVTPEVAFELYGGMNDEGQRLRANYHLKWTVIRQMKQDGVKRYDVNGLLNDGVTSFKKGFIPDETTMSGTFVKPMSPLFTVWDVVLPAVKKVAQAVKR